MPQLSLHAPVGDLTVSEEDGRIVALDWGWGCDQSHTPLLRRAVDQLYAYFDGALRDFDLPIEPAGTAFQGRVWAAMRAIAYGETRSYGQVAALLGSSARAVGGACGANPVPILIPCHRIVGAAGPTGYSGGEGIDTKTSLLALESGVFAEARRAA